MGQVWRENNAARLPRTRRKYLVAGVRRFAAAAEFISVLARKKGEQPASSGKPPSAGLATG
jgi:hypothetical protein